MNFRRVLLATVFALLAALGGRAQESAAAADPATAQQAVNTAAAAAVASGHADPRTSDFVEHLVDIILSVFDVRSSGNTALDEQALRAVQAVVPFEPPPRAMTIALDIPFAVEQR